jgi:hypothetical protein
MDVLLDGDLAALLATLLAAVAAWPQLWRVVRAGDGRGVSLTSAALGIGGELAWVTYALERELWSALPEAVLMLGANAALAIALFARGAAAGPALGAGLAWVVLLGTVHAVGGATALGASIGVAYVVQVTPAVWTVWRTTAPTGVASTTWVLVGAEGVLWATYAIRHEDPAILTFAVTATLAAAATLARTLTVQRGVVARA